MLTHTYLRKPLRKIKVTISSHHFTYDKMSALVICKQRKEYGHTWHWMSLLTLGGIKQHKTPNNFDFLWVITMFDHLTLQIHNFLAGTDLLNHGLVGDYAEDLVPKSIFFGSYCHWRTIFSSVPACHFNRSCPKMIGLFWSHFLGSQAVKSLCGIVPGSRNKYILGRAASWRARTEEQNSQFSGLHCN